MSPLNIPPYETVSENGAATISEAIPSAPPAACVPAADTPAEKSFTH